MFWRAWHWKIQAPSEQGQNHENPDAEGKGQGRRKGSEPGTGWNSVQIITKGKERGGRFMYKKKIEQYIEAHKQEMLDDICALCSINSERSAYQEGDPFGEGPSRARHRH